MAVYSLSLAMQVMIIRKDKISNILSKFDAESIKRVEVKI